VQRRGDKCEGGSHRTRRGNETHFELNVMPTSTSGRAGLYTEILPTKRPELGERSPEWVNARVYVAPQYEKWLVTKE
jgi:hypothetical protein